MSEQTDQPARFVESLRSLVNHDDRAALAALRRGLGKPPGTVAEMYRYVVPWLPSKAERWHEDAYFLVASLFAWHQRTWEPKDGDRRSTNLGASFARLMRQNGTPSTEQRFVALLNSHSDDLGEHLRSAVGVLKAGDIPIDWAQLLRDIQGWGRESRSVQRAWALAYWGGARKQDEETTAEPETVPAG